MTSLNAGPSLFVFIYKVELIHLLTQHVYNLKLVLVVKTPASI